MSHKANLGMGRKKRHSYNCSSYTWSNEHRSGKESTELPVEFEWMLSSNS